MGLTTWAALSAAAFALAWVFCGVARDVGRRRNLIDVPNERSLHSAPVPRLGGVAVVVACCCVLVVGSRLEPLLRQRDVRVWMAGAVVIALMGFVDDVRSLSAPIRLAVQVAVAATVLLLAPLGDPVTITSGISLQAGPVVGAVAVVFVAGTTNVYNFMDGMDGLAAAQGIGAGTVLGFASARAGQTDIAAVFFVIAAGCGGFFLHNAPPAKLFLGDAGSTFLGFTFSMLGLLAASRPTPVPLAASVLALAPFLLDGGFTLARRARRGERIWQAHRSHLYQRAVGAGFSHGRVLVVYAAWVLVACASAVLAGEGGAAKLAAACLLMVGAFSWVWRWVVRSERLRGRPGL